ncbi:hypothetical protein FRC15_009729 [Serendipita sp. 397]|nr:hypothetical protein FRC15_009729 [Serendipita sp. 397]
MFASALAALLLASLVRSEPVPLEPSGTSVFNEGGNCTILWTPDTTGVWTTMNIELMTGDNFNQVHLKTVATVDGTDATNPSFSYPCLSVTPNARIYFYKFSSPATSDILFTTRFTIADASGNSVSATQSQTATNGDVVAYGTGALEDPSQGDEPPVVGTASASAMSTLRRPFLLRVLLSAYWSIYTLDRTPHIVIPALPRKSPRSPINLLPIFEVGLKLPLSSRYIEPMNFEDIQEATGYEQGLAAEIARRETQALLDELERKKRARAIAVPTDDGRVKKRLRELGEPITLFGERAADRRARLIHLLSQKGDDVPDAMDVDEGSDEEEEEFYTPGSLDLLEARRRIAEYSVPRARARVSKQREETKIPLTKIIEMRRNLFGELKKMQNIGSEVGDERAISLVRFSPNSQMLATGSWSGTVKVWNIPKCTLSSTHQGHSDKVGGVAWHPSATISLSPSAANLVSGAAEGNVHLWSLDSEVPLSVLLGHKARVARVCFHPSGKYVVSASFDGTWRLWDVETSAELLLQSGHSKEVFAVACQIDGSLVASGALKPIVTIPAHRSNVSDLRFFHSSSPLCSLEGPDVGEQVLTEDQVYERYRSGLYLASAGYDGLVKIWSADDWQLVKALTADSEKVMSVDLSSDGKYLASGSFSRSYQLFTTEGYSG